MAKFGKKPNKTSKISKADKAGKPGDSAAAGKVDEATNVNEVAQPGAVASPNVDSISDDKIDSKPSNPSNPNPSNGKVRIFRNPSGRSARIVPELRVTTTEVERLPNSSPPTPPAEPTTSPISAADLIDADADFSVAQVTGSYRRERSIEGLLLGTSVGDALGLGRDGLSRSSSLRIMGRGPIDYCLIPGVGIVSSDTHRMLMTLQSILRSRSQMELFRRNFAMRLRFYLFSLPVSAGRATILATVRLWLGVPAAQSGIDSDDNSPLVNALAIATVLQGTGHSIERWVAVSTEVTQITPEVTDAAILIARTAFLAIMTDPNSFSPISMLDRLKSITDDTTLTGWLQALQTGLEENLGTHAMAVRLGWGDRIPGTAGPTAIMAIYAWLRHHDDFEQAVESAVLLGGDSVTLGALAGGLAGINLGSKNIPARWLSRLWSWPNNRRWLDTLTRRFTDWPHGSEDLHAAPGMPTRAGLQLLRSGVLAVGVAIGAVIKIPWKLSHWIVGS